MRADVRASIDRSRHLEPSGPDEVAQGGSYVRPEIVARARH